MIPTTFIEVMIVNLGLAIFLLASQLMWTKVPTLSEFLCGLFGIMKFCKAHCVKTALKGVQVQKKKCQKNCQKNHCKHIP